ncbi:hypothetical protein [[Clostridium] polysaccharolyticum]|uniref:ABC-2 family transporter protein n=1 Tax=[Clostridium] polysaccharolyticum TaxID=29364 RepID=A0A1I0DDW9_9FIRM|nr:hypothetical protein [[Clostridium] polysaccharolyticum]SET30556.1 hypothetical protein SAMN04487772_11426 [[Clostridium] polysaccharolyticum]
MKYRLGNIIRAEARKLLQNNLFRISLLMLFFANFIILMLSYHSNPAFNHSYRKFKMNYEHFGKTEQERLDYAKELCVKKQVMKVYGDELSREEEALYSFARSQDIAKQEGYSDAWYEEVKKEYLSGSRLEYGASAEEEAGFLLETLEEIKYIASYQEYLDSVQEKVKDNFAIKSFAENQSEFSKKNLRKMSKDYKRMESVKPVFSGTNGLAGILGAIRLDICPCILLGVVSILLFLEDKRNGISKLYRSTWNGRGGIFLAKTVVMLLSCMFIVIVYWGGNFVFIWKVCGGIPLQAPVQSIVGFQQCIMKVSIGEYLVYYALQKMFALFVIGLIYNLIGIWAENYVTFFIFVGTGGAVSGFCAYMIPKYTFLSPFRYLNLIYYGKAAQMTKHYLNFNVMGHPVGKCIVCNIAACLLALFMLSAGLSLYGRCERVYHNYSISFHRKIKRRKKANVSVLRHEIFKVFYGSRVLVLIMLLLFTLSYITVYQPYYLNEEEYYYQMYMKKLEGEVTEEKLAYIQQEEERIESIHKQIQSAYAKYENGQMAEDVMNALVGMLRLKIKGENAFEKVKSRLEYINIHKKEQYPLVYEDGWNCVFGLCDIGVRRDKQNAFLCAAALIICLGGIFANEYETGMNRLHKVSLRGRRYTAVCKLGMSELTLVITMAVVYSQDFFFASRSYGIHSLFQKAKSIPEFAECFGAGGTILQYCIILFLVRFLGYSLLLMVNYVISRFTKSTIKTMLFLFLFFVFPVVMSLLRIEQVDRFSLNYLFYGNKALQLLGKIV